MNRRIARTIRQQSGIADPEKFHDWVRNSRPGESFEDFKLQSKNQFLTQRVISEEVYRNMIIPKPDMQKYYDEHKSEFIRQEMVSLREILVSIGDGSPEKVAAAEKKAKEPGGPRAQGREICRSCPPVFRRAQPRTTTANLESSQRANLRRKSKTSFSNRTKDT